MRITERIADEFIRVKADIAANNPEMERLQLIEETLSVLADDGWIAMATMTVLPAKKS